MRNISLFKNFTNKVGSRTLAEVVSGIRGNYHKESILKIRDLVDIGDKEKVDQLKKGLVAFTVSGNFEGGRKLSFLKTYNPLVILDIDKLHPDTLPSLISKIQNIDFTRVAFISPSGRGLKIIVAVDSKMEMHGLAYRQVCSFYEKELDVAIDKSGKDITRLCFMSYDPAIYFNEKSPVFKIELVNTTSTQLAATSADSIPSRAPKIIDQPTNLTSVYLQTFTRCMGQTNSRMTFEKGNRNNYIYQLAVSCHHAGLPEKIVIEECKRKFDFDHYEMERTIKSAYNWKPAPVNEDEVVYVKTGKEFVVELPPTISDQLFDKLPAILKTGCSHFKVERERDAYLTSALGVLSGCLPEVSGVYDGRTVYPNLYVFVIDPSDDRGRAAVYSSRSLGSAYNNEMKSGDKEEIKKLFFSTIDSEVLSYQLEKNGGSGILFYPSINSMSKDFTPEWNQYLTLLKIAFHHDTISSSRELEENIRKIKQPKLSVVLSGTPGVLTNLISSVKDGLYHRFLFYAFEEEAIWQRVVPSGRSIQEIRESLSKEVLEMVHFLESYPTKFTLSKGQWEILNTTFSKLLNEISAEYGDHTRGVVKRMGLILFRIAMILSAIRKFNEKNVEKELVCTDNDFQVAKSLVETYLQHSLFVYDLLPEFEEGDLEMKEFFPC